MLVNITQIPGLETKVFSAPGFDVNVFRLYYMPNIALSGQSFERDEDIPVRVAAVPTDSSQDATEVIIVIELYDATTTPETRLLSKDNGSGLDPDYEGGGIIRHYEPKLLMVDFVFSHKDDFLALPEGQKNIKYKVYTIYDKIKRHAKSGQFTIKA